VVFVARVMDSFLVFAKALTAASDAITNAIPICLITDFMSKLLGCFSVNLHGECY